MSIVFGTLIVFVSSEVWEIPIFILGYLRFSGYGFPQVLNHIIIGLMAFLLIVFSRFKLTVTNASILVLNVIINSFGLWFYSSIVIGWILRTLTLTCLSYVFLKEIHRNG
jgi:membrane-associated HD superfamily phosphohydrolase